MTLKDISKATGYSLTSIHRAIYNKEGLSPATRDKILEAVKSMGYEVNYLASSLKRKTLNIAFVGKKPRVSHDYHHMIAEGVKSAFSQDMGMNIALREFYFDGKASDLEDEECRILSDLYYQDDLDGLVIMPINTGIKLQLAVQKLIGKGYPVVLVDDSFAHMDFLCAVEPFNDFIGQTGAEFMSQICKPGKLLVALGNASSKGQMENYESFVAYLQNHAVPITCIPVQDCFDKAQLVDTLVSLIDDEVVGLYTVCESNTPAICKAALASGRKDLKVLGCDLSPDNKTYLEDGVLSGILDMNSYLQGFLAMRILLEFILKNIRPKASVLSVPVRLVLRSSLAFFEGEYSAGISIASRNA
ncbi:MAG: substrate-binding domain-containing protein [Sphaerochaeta sp.]|jgi:LacI family transcriptional regulator|uniref:substrate-binding domain-containing protein n=1 Tax=Sphaerochaeta sp. TaxID=1972642 RepID=UPI003D09F5EC